MGFPSLLEKQELGNTALRRSRYFGTSSGFWMNGEMRCDLYRAERKEGDEVRREHTAVLKTRPVMADDDEGPIDTRPSDRPTSHTGMTESERLRELENRLWKAADQLRANSSLAASQYWTPVLGLIFLRYADVRFTQVEKELDSRGSGRRQVGKADYQAQGVMYVPDEARFGHLQMLPEGSDLGAANEGRILDPAVELRRGDPRLRRPAP